MSAYGTLLKRLIRFSGFKMTTIAEIVGYDTSYISKWCNKDKLPASKSASNVNKTIADTLAHEILAQNDAVHFASEFNTASAQTEGELSAVILGLLRDAYRASLDQGSELLKVPVSGQNRTFIGESEAASFFRNQLPELIRKNNGDCDILCSLSLCTILKNHILDSFGRDEPNLQIHVQMGLEGRLGDDDHYLKAVYFLINRFSYIDFNFYDSSELSMPNMIVIRDCAVILCTVDANRHFVMLNMITEPAAVTSVYGKMRQEMIACPMLARSSDSKDLLMHGYRTEFYAHRTYQIFLTRGFEFLLPPEIIPRLIQKARDLELDPSMPQLIAQLGITWEEIFEKGTIDFFILKTSLLRYISDGIIYFADVEYKMSIEERQKHISYVYQIVEKNPNITFHIIDDDQIHKADLLVHTSIYNNMNKLFLKNTERYGKKYGPKFYTVPDRETISAITRYFNDLTNNPICTNFTAAAAMAFFDTFGTMIQRMLSLDIQ